MQLFPGRIAYMLVLTVVVIDIIWIQASVLTFAPRQLALPAITFGLLAACSVLIGRISYSTERIGNVCLRLGYLLQGMAFLQIGWIAIRLFNHVSMTTDFGYADELLSAWDRYLPFDWKAYFDVVQDHPALIFLLDHSYTSLTPISLVGFLLLIAQGELKRARYFLETFLVVAIVCIAIGMFFPARAAVATYLGDIYSGGWAAGSNFTGIPGVYHLELLEKLRAGKPFALDLDNLPGLVTFPSFHTAAGVVLAASFWRTKLFVPVSAYCTVMIASTPIFGGHYFIDLIAGVAIAFAVLYVYASFGFYEGMFRQKRAASGLSTVDDHVVKQPLS